MLQKISFTYLSEKYNSLTTAHPELENEQSSYKFMNGTEMLDAIGKVIYEKEFKTYRVYKQFIFWHQFENHCSGLLRGLKDILQQTMDLNHTQVQNWVAYNNSFFQDHIFSLYNRLDLKNDTADYFDLYETNEFLEKKEFKNVICFHQVMWILHFGEYHLPVADRKPPAKPGEYYYVPPDPNEPTDLEKIHSLL